MLSTHVRQRSGRMNPSTPMADNNFRSDRGRDLIEELARRIVQAHPDVESAPAESGCRGETAWDSYEVPPELPLASRLQVYGDAPEQTSELDEHHDDGSYDVDDQPCADDEHQDDATRVRRPKLVVAMAMFSLALAGTVGAFGHRATISGAGLPMLPPIINASNEPTKIAPAANEPHAKNAANASQVDTVTTGSIEKLVSREEQPVTIVPPKPTSRVISTIPITTRQELAHPRGPAGRACASGHAGGTEPRGVGPRGGGCRSYAAECGPIECRGRHPCIEQRAFCQRKHHRGGKPSCFRRRLYCSSYFGAQRKRGSSCVSGAASEIRQPA